MTGDTAGEIRPPGGALTEERLAGAVREVALVRRAGRARATAVSAALLAAAFAALCLALSVGDFVVPLREVVATLAGGGDAGSRFVIIELRLPRALTGLLVGAAFGLSGAVFQTLLRNPLASPDMIGITWGASAAGVLASAVFGVSGFPLSVCALAGALLTAVAIYALAWREGVAGYRLVLVGVGVGAGLSSLVSYLLTSSAVTEAQKALAWLTGSLNGRSWEQMWPLLGAMVVLVPLTFLAARSLPAMQLGDDTARGLGTRVERGRPALIGCAVALAGVATAAAGPVGFVAFLSAPIARRLLPRQGAALLPAALTGALIVSVADFAAQHLLGSVQFPVGVVTSMIGAPYLLWLLARSNRVGKGG
ncbi:iron chelate uptake ABC transporter family permease subunit [Streptomyces scopuliridis]|uniref:Iron-siderophore uptake system transmembrane protein n=2 Tax=Streptomyces scopuliridis TaxID=452529 RepID=A0A2T7T7I6_9ACTN|nr:iron chelate uptake ABC transporter family permease subunit [Streptomyces scopuliridis]PVE11127.1 iron-siderophore uptake system transmembrane protein [Streptomyces scopuliridis RB72]WSB31981.1 iron chelate uptake ABC transporter family permease subunit [Streptomyces scopuliridis]WSB96241.1 iron chelate uptake ABC transporter family permease subunit [Streptomyces scopuliridis]WSC10053.1 iron chelate uptake ABC transporter family permease subunit [Streptomyces scopuliridis]